MNSEYHDFFSIKSNTVILKVTRCTAYSRGLKHIHSEGFKFSTQNLSQSFKWWTFRTLCLGLLYIFPLLCSHNVELFSLESHDGGHKLGVCWTERWPRLSLCFSYFNLNAGTTQMIYTLTIKLTSKEKL